MRPVLVKARRYARKAPRIALREFRDSLLDRNQFLGLLISAIGLWLILLHASDQERDVQATAWAVGVEAFGIAIIFWAFICLLRAPLIAKRADDERGRWFPSAHGLRFVYNSPLRVATERCAATGELERFKICFHDAEPGAFVYYHIEVENEHVLPHMFVAVFSEIWMTRELGQSILKAGILLPKDNSAWLAVRMAPNLVSQTIRVYMHDFTVGHPEDKDGLERRPDKPVRPVA